MKILFWNTQKNENINAVLSELIIENNISIVVLAEYESNIDELIEMLSLQNIFMTRYITAGCERIKVLGSIQDVKPSVQTDQSSIQIINNDIIMCCVHLNSQIYSGHKDQREIHIGRIVNDIQATERDLCTNNTVIVGDFNINPYDDTCINARFLHGMPIYEVAKRKERTVAGEKFSMFYNPMWNFLGDRHQPYGTYYYNGSDAVNTYWNIYDQVIIRPALKDLFIDKSLKILTETKTIYLLDKNGHPNKKISDHLPIMFEIKEDNHG